jgi:multicomponent Na+:H+ antiporter subunit F
MKQIILYSLLGGTAIAVLLGFISMFKSRIAAEKMVALDVVTTVTTGVLLLLSVLFSSGFILDIAIIYAVLSFGAILAFARFHEGGI